jgi:precorrin-2 methylase
MALHRSIILAILLAVCTTLVSAAAISRSEQSVEAPGQVYCGNLGDPVIYTSILPIKTRLGDNSANM